MEDQINPEISELGEDELEQTSGGIIGKSLQAKASKLNLDNSAIDAGMKEASQKANNAMDAANTSLITGIVGGIIQK